MGHPTEVTGDPGSINVSARALMRLAGSLEQTATVIGRARSIPDHDFDGDTADAFRSSMVTVDAGANRAAIRNRGFGRALLVYADRLAEVKATMRRARRVARGHDLLVGTTIALPGEPTDEQREIYRNLGEIVSGAWAVLKAAEDDLRSTALQVAPGAADLLSGSDGLKALLATEVPDDATISRRLPADWPPAEWSWPPDRPIPDAAPAPRSDHGTLGSRGAEPAQPWGRHDEPVSRAPRAHDDHLSGVADGARAAPHPNPPAHLAPVAVSLDADTTGLDHHLPDVQLSLPTTWALHGNLDTGVLLVAEQPVPLGTDSPAATLRLEVLPPDGTTPEGSPSGFDDEPIHRTLTEGEPGRGATREQWTWHGSTGVLRLTGLVPHGVADDESVGLSRLFAQVAQSLSVSDERVAR